MFEQIKMHGNYQRSAMPRYVQLADLMRQRIARGIWPENHRLPSLERLVEEFGVARVTVRQAVAVLVREGLVSAQQGRGTFVTNAPKHDRFISVVTTLEELRRNYHDTRPEIININESVTSPPIRPGEGGPASRYVYMQRVHYRDGQAYCVIHLYLDEKIFRKSPAKFRAQPVILLLTTMKGVNIAHAHQVLTIGTADMEVARLLDLPMNAPVAEVRRIFKDENNTVIYVADVTYRGEAIRVEMDLKP